MSKIVFPKTAKELIKSPIPDNLIKERPGGGNKKLSYISGQTVIDYLNKAFDYLWDFEIIKVWKEESEAKFNPKYDKEPKPQGPVANAIVKITIPLFDAQGNYVKDLSKMGTGSKSILGSQSDQESIFKAAVTDGLKKAASLFGIGLELYRDEDEQQFFDEMNEDNPWTDEALEKYKSQSDYITQFMEDNNLDVDQMNACVKDFSQDALETMNDIVPDNIESFVEYLKKIAASQEK